MRVAVSFFAVAVVAAGGGWFAARHSFDRGADRAEAKSSRSERRIKFYQSPMHPWITSDKPGKCTICGMTLVPVYEGEAGADPSEAGVVTLPAPSATVIGVQTSEVRRAPLIRTLRVTGALDDDETRRRVLSARTPGRIERLWVDQVGATVRAGQAMATLYSPEVLSAERVYIERFVAGPDATTASELSAARERLFQLGLVDEDIRRIEKTRQPESELKILAPFDGVVISRTTYAGAYVRETDALFEVADLSRLWFVFDAYEPDLAFLKIGQSVEISVPSLPGQKFSAPIDFIDPNLDPLTRSARVRVVLDNTSRQFLHRQTATGLVQIGSSEVLLVSRSALVLTNEAPLVYLERADGVYQARTVQLGRMGDREAEVLGGLSPGDRVVTQGALLIDAQAQLSGQTASASDTHSHDSHMHDPDEASPAPTPQAQSAAVPLDDALIFAAADAAEALANDDLGAYAKLLPGLVQAAQPEPLGALAKKLVDAPDLEHARAAFEPWSTALADAVLARPDAERKVSVFQCPMSPVLGTGRWVSRNDVLRNPFFGSEMLECGVKLAAPSSHD